MRCTAPLLVGLALAAYLSARPQESPPRGPPAPRPAAAERYPFLYDFTAQHEPTPEMWAKLPFERLTLRRGGCYGICPVYEVELRRDGTARYTGGAHAPRQGEFKGQVGLYSYALLCAAVEDLNLAGIAGWYHADWTDDENIIVEWSREGHEGHVHDYARQAPPSFQAYRALFDELAALIEWTPLEEQR